LLAALSVQLSPWCFWSIVSTSTLAAPESLLSALAALFGAVFLRECYYRPRGDDESNPRGAVLLGAITGIMLATKVTAMPLAAAPLVALRFLASGP
jgi:hypothetical protein